MLFICACETTSTLSSKIQDSSSNAFVNGTLEGTETRLPLNNLKFTREKPLDVKANNKTLNQEIFLSWCGPARPVREMLTC